MESKEISGELKSIADELIQCVELIYPLDSNVDIIDQIIDCGPNNIIIHIEHRNEKTNAINFTKLFDYLINNKNTVLFVSMSRAIYHMYQNYLFRNYPYVKSYLVPDYISLSEIVYNNNGKKMINKSMVNYIYSIRLYKFSKFKLSELDPLPHEFVESYLEEKIDRLAEKVDVIVEKIKNL
jgi:hypothetical protein